jgi:hypothetical protein
MGFLQFLGWKFGFWRQRMQIAERGSELVGEEDLIGVRLENKVVWGDTYHVGW